VGWLSIMFQEWWLMERYYYCFSRLPLFSLVIIACCCSLSVRNTTATHNIHTYVQCGLDLFSVRFHWSISSSWLAPQGIVTLYRYVVQSDWIRLVFLLLGVSYQTHCRWETFQVSNGLSRLRLWCHGLVQ
jgi:hypothetical protein